MLGRPSHGAGKSVVPTATEGYDDERERFASQIPIQTAPHLLPGAAKRCAALYAVSAVPLEGLWMLCVEG